MESPALNRRKRLITIILVLLLISALGLAAYLWASYHNKDAGKYPVDSTTPEIATVHVTADGFQPAELAVNKNTVVEWLVDDDSKTHQVASNPYPEHTDLPGLFSDQIGKGASYRYSFDKAGTFKYHDQLNPALNGTITVK